ncbi:MAG: hypothetical protein IH621_04780 [Krumholzibacteria bacterium]|nr:hypothetical protein [Candidatus Krumholzibacteria bacterium]
MPVRLILLLAVGLLAVVPGRAGAAGAGAIALTFNVSARAEGMGGAGVAGVWGGDTNLWANPALLAFRPGVRYSTMHSQLVAGLADDIFIDKQELTLGYAGFGLLYGRSPLDHVFLDMGTQQGTDESGNPTGTFQSWEKSQAWGVGAGLTQLLDAFAGTSLERWFDLAGGVVWRSFEDHLAPAASIQDPQGGGSGEASSRDLGWVARVTPLDTRTMVPDLADSPVGLVLEAAYGKAKQNDTEEFIVHVDADQADPLPTAYVSGWSSRVAFVPGGDLTAGLPPAVRDAVTSLFTWNYAEQTIEPGYIWTGSDYVYEHDESGLRDVDSRGHEFSFLNVLFLRRGHYTDAAGGIDAPTTGWGLNLPVRRFGGVRYDKATVPQARGLPTVDRSGWHLWVDVVAILDAR